MGNFIMKTNVTVSILMFTLILKLSFVISKNPILVKEMLGNCSKKS